MGVTDGNTLLEDWRDSVADDRNDEAAFQRHMEEQGATQIGVALFKDQ